MRFSCLIICFFGMIADVSYAKETISDVTFKCFEKSEKEYEDCTDCKKVPIVAKTQACLRAAGFRDISCSVFAKKVTCRAANAEKLFPQSQNCSLAIYPGRFFGERAVVLLNRPDSKSCLLNGFESALEVFDVDYATSNGDGTWRVDGPVIGLGFEKVIAGTAVKIEESRKFSEIAQQKKEENECRNSLLNLRRIPKALRMKKLEELGFADGKMNLNRHFVPKTVEGDFIVAETFRAKSDFKVCGAAIPKDSNLMMVYTSSACRAATNGALTLKLLPVSSFPNVPADPMQVPNASTAVSCVPKAQNASEIQKLMQEKVSRPPVLDWQDCDCRQYQERD